MRFLSLLAAGGLIAWLISLGVAAAERENAFPPALPWLALAVLVSLLYAFGWHWLASRR